MRRLPFDYAVRNLGRSPSRALLSIAGSTLVVLLILASAAFVRGMSASLGETGSQENIILLGAGSEESIERSEIAASTPAVLAATVGGIRSRAGVEYVSPQVHVMLPINAGSQEEPGARQVLVRGVTPEALLVHERVRMMDGRWPRPGMDEVMVGRMAGATLGVAKDAIAVDETLVIDGRPWRIVGQFSAPGTVLEGEVWTSLTDIMEATKRTTISCVVLRVDPAEAEFADVAAFTKMRPDLELSAMTEREYYARLGAFFGPVRFVAWTTAGLIALGGLFGGLNTMYAAFASRVRELGTLQAIGYRRSSIIISLVQESLVATAGGALIACGLAVLLLDGVAVRFSMGAFGLIVDAAVLLVGLGAGVALGLFGALPPAVRSLRLSIPVALKAV